jgi:hypothetical protein
LVVVREAVGEGCAELAEQVDQLREECTVQPRIVMDMLAGGKEPGHRPEKPDAVKLAEAVVAAAMSLIHFLECRVGWSTGCYHWLMVGLSLRGTPRKLEKQLDSMPWVFVESVEVSLEGSDTPGLDV